MSKCSWCGTKKAKRGCPAIGSICAPCCGEHRQREITFPETCFYLGRAGKQAHDRFQALYKKLVDEFLVGQRPPRRHVAVNAWLDEHREIGDWEQAGFFAYLLHG